ncbi:MAG: RloB domain-containing protein [Bacteroidia bacterium]|nr:RloB domain-containing protein [Bacteroidia bacterium]
MARKVKIDNSVLKRLQRKETSRVVNSKPKRKYILIVCEGEKTEPNYFKALKDSLPKGVLEVCEFRIVGTGHNTSSLVRKAMQLRTEWETETRRTVDKLWVVFDRDSFTPTSFNTAINTCIRNRPKVDCAWSNEAFELWYLLHFHYYNTGISRADYQRLIENNFRAKGLVGYHYEKNSTEMYSLLQQYGDQNAAIRNAKRLERTYMGRRNYANQNPCTTVYQLVEELENLKEREE